MTKDRYVCHHPYCRAEAEIITQDGSFCEAHNDVDARLAKRPVIVLERCINCGAEIPNVKVPPEIADISGTLMCAKCAEAEGLPTLMSQLGLRLECEGSK